MATSVTSVVNHFPSAENGFTTTTSGSVSSGAVTVGLNSVAGYTNGEIAVFVIDPTDTSKKQTFTGIIDTGGIQVTSVVWTAGTNQNHALGATVVDYATATHISMMTKGILVHADQDGTLKAGAVDNTAVLADSIVTKDKLSTALELEHDTGWNLSYAGTTVPVPNTVTNNGNRSYDMVFNSVDLTGYLSEGQRLRTTRTVSAPTQCADLEASSSQYFSKASATGFSTGTTWTWKAKIKPESYGLYIIASLDDGTNIIQLYLNASGQVVVAGGTSGAQDLVTSYQSVALGKWQDVTGSITIGTPTGEIRIDDVVVPSFVTNTAATTMTINGDETLNIGRNNGGGHFDGKICQVAIFNAIISDATLKTYSGQTMTGSETNCKGFWSLNGVLTDSSASANTLTASGGALATNVDSPFGSYLGGTLEYGIITKTAFSTNTTLTVQVPEGCAIPTSGGVSAVAYSTQANPYKWPGISEIIGESIVCAAQAGITTATDVLGLTTTVYVPANKGIQIESCVPMTNGTVDAISLAYIYEGATQLQGAGTISRSGGSPETLTPTTQTLYPTEGSHTYKIRAAGSGGTSATLPATTAPSYIKVRLVDR